MRNIFQPGDEVTPIDLNDLWYGQRLEIVDIQQEIAMVGERDFVFATDGRQVRMFKTFELKHWQPGKRSFQQRSNPMLGRGDRWEDWPEEIEL